MILLTKFIIQNYGKTPKLYQQQSDFIYYYFCIYKSSLVSLFLLPKKRSDKELIDYKAEKDKDLELMKHEFQLKLERNKKNFGIKHEAYEAFFTNLDNFQNKTQIDHQKEIHDNIQTFLIEFIRASELNDQNLISQAISKYHANIQQLFLKIQDEVNILNNQNNKLKFVAPEIIRMKLQEITDGYNQTFALTNSYIGNIASLFFQEEEVKKTTDLFNANILPINIKLQDDMKQIEQLLRDDLFS